MPFSGRASWLCSGLNQTLNIWIASPPVPPMQLLTQERHSPRDKMWTQHVWSPLIFEKTSDKNGEKANSHKQTRHIQHIFFQTSWRGRCRGPPRRCCSKVHLSRCYDWPTAGKISAEGKLEQPVSSPAKGQAIPRIPGTPKQRVQLNPL